MAPHPFDDLSPQEIEQARDVVLKLHPGHTIFFRYIFLEEAPKSEIKKYLEDEHAGRTPSPLDRRALVLYDAIGSDRIPAYNESVINITNGQRVDHRVVDKEYHASLTVPEFRFLVEACEKSEMFKKCLEEYQCEQSLGFCCP